MTNRTVLKLTIVLSVISIFTGFGIKHLQNTNDISYTVAMHHGPNPALSDVPVKNTGTAAILGDSTIKKAGNKLLTTNIAVGLEKQYGIAGGGGLVYLSQDELNRYFENLVALGVKWVRWDIDWSYVQKTNSSSSNWGGVDRVVETSQRYGINSLAILTYTPQWARDSACIDSFVCQPKNTEDFGNFVSMAAKRYKDKIRFWEIWNEPNITTFFEPRPNVNKYYELLKIAYTKLKEVDSQSTVISGGLAPSANSSNGSTSPYTFIDKLYKLGFSKYCDAVALHPYTYPETPEYTIYWNSWKEMMSIRDLMFKKGDGAKKIWVTEFGAPIGGPGKQFNESKVSTYKYGVDYVSEELQKKMMTEAIGYYKRDTSSWMGPFFWYSLRDEKYSYNTPENFFGLVQRDWTKKPNFEVFKKLITQ